MTAFATGLFFIPLILSLLFLACKTAEDCFGKTFFITRYLRSCDKNLISFLVAVKKFSVSYKERISLFILNGAVYPIHRISRRLRFRLSAWYFHFLEGLHRRHMARYRKQTSLYLRTLSSKESGNSQGPKTSLQKPGPKRFKRK